MPLAPPPTIAANLLLVKQKLIRVDMSRAAEVEYALVCADSFPATYQDAIDDFQTNFNTYWTADMDTDVTALPPEGRGGDGTNVPLLVTAAGPPVTGTQASLVAPPSVAMLIAKRTGFGGRSNRGRTYMPFVLTQAQVNENGSLAGGVQAAFDATAAAFLAQLVTDGTSMYIENKTFNQPAPPRHVTHIGPSIAVVTSYKVESLIATQRRRLGR